MKGSDDNVKWQVVPVLGLPKITAAGGVRFQMFTSGLAGRHTFLLDTATGRSWVFTEFKDGNAWAPMMEVE